MPRYYFDWIDEGYIFRDKEGLDLPSLEVATADALKSLTEYARDAAIPRDVSIDILDDEGHRAARVKVSVALEVGTA